MTISSTVNVKKYLGDGSNTIFNYTSWFWIIKSEDMAVYLDGILQSTGYTVTGAGSKTSGDVIFDVAPANQVEVILHRIYDFKQLTDYEDYRSEEHTSELQSR